MSYASEVVADGPALWWRLGDASGTTAADASGSSRPGTYGGSPTLGVAGLVGDSDTAVGFDGIDDYVTRTATILSAVSSLSIEIWFKTTATSGYLFNVGAGTVTNFDVTIQPGNVFRAFTRTGSTFRSINGPVLNDGNPHHIVVTFIQSTTTARLYVDGVEYGNVTNMGNATANLANPFVGASSATTSFLAGTLDEFAIYNGALSAARVAAHYAAAIPPSPVTVHPVKIASAGTIHSPAIVPYIAPVDGNATITAELAPAAKSAACIQPDRSAQIAPARHAAGVNAT